MNFKRIVSLVCFYVAGLIAVLSLFSFLGLRLFHFSDAFGVVMHNIILYLGLFCVFAGALAYAIGRKNRIFSILLLAFLVVVIVFFVVL